MLSIITKKNLLFLMLSFLSMSQISLCSKFQGFTLIDEVSFNKVIFFSTPLKERDGPTQAKIILKEGSKNSYQVEMYFISSDNPFADEIITKDRKVFWANWSETSPVIEIKSHSRRHSWLFKRKGSTSSDFFMDNFFHPQNRTKGS